MRRGITLGDAVRAVDRSIVDDEDVPVLAEQEAGLRLLEERVEAAGQIALFIPARGINTVSACVEGSSSGCRRIAGSVLRAAPDGAVPSSRNVNSRSFLAADWSS